jgi:hypothetical protein
MAGAGYKSWSGGDILAAAEVNTYLMDQSVMVFGGSASRSASIGTVTEGMVSYLTDTNVLEAYNGSAWVSLNSLGGTVAGSQVTGSITTATIPAENVTNTLTSSAGTAYSVVASDQGKVLRFTAAGTVIATVGTATAFTAGQRVDILADGTAGVRIAAGSGVTFAGAGTAGTAYTLAQYEAATVLSVASNTYRIIGNVEAV